MQLVCLRRRASILGGPVRSFVSSTVFSHTHLIPCRWIVVPLKSETKHGCGKLKEIQHYVEWLFTSPKVQDIAEQYSFVSFPVIPQILAEVRKMTCNGTLVYEMPHSSMLDHQEITFVGPSLQKSLQDALTGQHFLDHGT